MNIYNQQFIEKDKNNNQSMRVIEVGIGDMKLSRNRSLQLATYALGSCLGITLYDPEIKLGGIFHAMLPSFQYLKSANVIQPLMFLDIGLPLFFRIAYAAGAKKENLIIKVAGGAAFTEDQDKFQVGKRNLLSLRKMLWQNDLMIHNEEVGGVKPRSLFLELSTGRTWIKTNNELQEL